MKLAGLLTEFLLTNKQLELPGIGIFRISNVFTDEMEINKSARSGSFDEITFENNPSIKEVPDLISFLCSRTGKMKALIAADLDTHLTQAKQFLNIGKPFLFEGIGSLSKHSFGEFEFVSEKLKDPASKEISITSSTEESFTGYRSIFSVGKAKALWKKPVLIIFLLSGVAVAVWLGYIVYKNTSQENPGITNEIKTELIPETVTLVPEKDSIETTQLNPQSDEQKYVLEITNKNRAIERFTKLKNYGWDIQMETGDSVAYKLFLSLRVPSVDSSWVIDSLTALYGKRVFIEN